MVLVWWAAHKLTWDCTLIDDTQDASGQGLLQQMGLDPSAGPPDASSPPGTTSRPSEPEATTSTASRAERRRGGKRCWSPTGGRTRRACGWSIFRWRRCRCLASAAGSCRRRIPWRERACSGLLVIYVASGMGLLLATSFLGLRRYLRQRKLEMPLEMTATWIIVGVVMICATLIVADDPAAAQPGIFAEPVAVHGHVGRAPRQPICDGQGRDEGRRGEESRHDGCEGRPNAGAKRAANAVARAIIGGSQQAGRARRARRRKRRRQGQRFRRSGKSQSSGRRQIVQRRQIEIWFVERRQTSRRPQRGGAIRRKGR